MMRSRLQSRGSSKQSPSNAVSNGYGRKTTKLPQIGSGMQDEQAPIGFSPVSSGNAIGVFSQQGKRPYQEDEYAIRPYLNQASNNVDSSTAVETHFFGLFDGHAGGRCSKHIAATLPNILADDSLFYSNLPQAIRRSFHTANDHFLKIAEKMKIHDGSTGICSLLRDNKILVANVGDCRALVISGRKPIQMSIDQKPTSPDEQKRIAALGGTVVYCMGVARVNRVLAVSRAFGNRTLRQVIRPDAEMMQRELTKDDDYLVMASDGLWDVFKNKEVAEICNISSLQGNPQLIAEELVHTALNRGSMDNVTCLVVRLRDFYQLPDEKDKQSSKSDTTGATASTVGSSVSQQQRPQSPSQGYSAFHAASADSAEKGPRPASSARGAGAGVERKGNADNVDRTGFAMGGMGAIGAGIGAGAAGGLSVNVTPNKQRTLGLFRADSTAMSSMLNIDSPNNSPLPRKAGGGGDMRIPLIKIPSSQAMASASADATADGAITPSASSGKLLKAHSTSVIPSYRNSPSTVGGAAGTAGAGAEDLGIAPSAAAASPMSRRLDALQQVGGLSGDGSAASLGHGQQQGFTQGVPLARSGLFGKALGGSNANSPSAAGGGGGSGRYARAAPDPRRPHSLNEVTLRAALSTGMPSIISLFGGNATISESGENTPMNYSGKSSKIHGWAEAGEGSSDKFG